MKSLYKRLDLDKRLHFHEGCVNSIDWDVTGQLLASGSDDTKIAIWDFDNGKVKASFDTGHTGNIFSARFFPCDSDHLASAAGDGQCKTYKLAQSSITVEHSYEQCFANRAKRVDFEPGNPFWFVACGEDGSVRQYDTRQKHVCDGPGSCSAALVYRGDDAWELNGVTVSPLKPEYFATGGSESVIRIYDRRMCSRSNIDNVTYAITVVAESKKTISGLHFAKDNMDIVATYMDDGIHVVNAWKPSEVDTNSLNPLAPEYNLSKPIQRLKDWLQEVEKASNEMAAMMYLPMLRALLPLMDIGEWAEILGMIFWNRALALAHQRQWNAIDSVEANLRQMRTVAPEMLKQERTFLMALSEVSKGKSPKEFLLHVLDTFDGTITNAAKEAIELPIPLLRDRVASYLTVLKPVAISTSKCLDDLLYQRGRIKSVSKLVLKGQHVNKQTVKDVAFVGNDFIGSGSDGGLMFLWSRTEGELVGIWKADRLVCNQVVGHPFAPIIATSGIDNDIKLWSPKPVQTIESGTEFHRIPEADYNKVVQAAAQVELPRTVYCPVQ